MPKVTQLVRLGRGRSVFRGKAHGVYPHLDSISPYVWVLSRVTCLEKHGKGHLGGSVR